MDWYDQPREELIDRIHELEETNRNNVSLSDYEIGELKERIDEAEEENNILKNEIEDLKLEVSHLEIGVKNLQQEVDFPGEG